MPPLPAPRPCFRAVLTTLALLVAAVVIGTTVPSTAARIQSTATPGQWLDVSTLHLVNYYPGATGPNPWTAMPVNAAQIDSDFARIAGLGANAVRLFVGTGTQANPDTTSRFNTVLSLASKHAMRVQLTLFDSYSTYNIPSSRSWLQSVVAPLAGDARIAFFELQNEMDPGNSAQMAWARNLLPYLQSISGGIPVTLSAGGWCDVSWQIQALRSGLTSAAIPDFWDIHYYCIAAQAPTLLRQAVVAAAPQRLIVGEAGYSTDASDRRTYNSEYGAAWQLAQQKVFFEAVDSAAAANGLAPAATWVDSDIDASRCSSCIAADRSFGLFRTDGSAKPVVPTVSAAFAGTVPTPDANLGVEEDAGGYPVAWTAINKANATLMHDSSFAHSGSWSVRISNVLRGSPAWSLDVPVAITPGLTYTATVWAAGRGIDGNAGLGLVFTDPSGNAIDFIGAPLVPRGSTAWGLFSASGVAPTNATMARIVLYSTSHRGTVWFDDAGFS